MFARGYTEYVALSKKDLEQINSLLDNQSAKFDKKLDEQSVSLKEYIRNQTDIVVREIAGAVADITENVGQLVEKNYRGHEKRITTLEKKLES